MSRGLSSSSQTRSLAHKLINHDAFVWHPRVTVPGRHQLRAEDASGGGDGGRGRQIFQFPITIRPWRSVVHKGGLGVPLCEESQQIEWREWTLVAYICMDNCNKDSECKRTLVWHIQASVMRTVGRWHKWYLLSIGDNLCSIHFYLKHFALGVMDEPAKKEEVPSNYLSFISLV